MFQNKAVVPSPRSGVGDVISINGDSLVIRNLTRHSAGSYVCRAVNPEGEGVSRPVYMAVMCEWRGHAVKVDDRRESGARPSRVSGQSRGACRDQFTNRVACI